MAEVLKFYLNTLIDSIIIINLAIPFLYFNFHMKSTELIGCAVVFFILFNGLGFKYWLTNKNKEHTPVSNKGQLK